MAKSTGLTAGLSTSANVRALDCSKHKARWHHTGGPFLCLHVASAMAYALKARRVRQATALDERGGFYFFCRLTMNTVAIMSTMPTQSAQPNAVPSHSVAMTVALTGSAVPSRLPFMLPITDTPCRYRP